MRKLITALLLIASCQLSAWASDKVIVELGPNARASAVAAAVGGEVLESIPGSSQVLLKVPSAGQMVPLCKPIPRSNRTWSGSTGIPGRVGSGRF